MRVGIRDPAGIGGGIVADVHPVAGAPHARCATEQGLDDRPAQRDADREALERARAVRALGSRDGLDAGVVDDLELAVSEILTNALLHGSPPTLVHLYEEADMWVCHVQDGGGLPVDPLAGVVPPTEPSDHGYGLWLARQLVAAVDVGSDLTGTHVRLHVHVPG